LHPGHGSEGLIAQERAAAASRVLKDRDYAGLQRTPCGSTEKGGRPDGDPDTESPDHIVVFRWNAGGSLAR
jgi:hypothetical protein